MFIFKNIKYGSAYLFCIGYGHEHSREAFVFSLGSGEDNNVVIETSGSLCSSLIFQQKWENNRDLHPKKVVYRNHTQFQKHLSLMNIGSLLLEHSISPVLPFAVYSHCICDLSI